MCLKIVFMINKKHEILIEVDDFSFTAKGNGKVLCLGKIEPRKRQVELLESRGDRVDFVGPIADSRFIPGKNYLGIWTKEDVLLLLKKGKH